MKDRTILHCDMNGFFASCELLDRPDLINKPMAVCGNPENRHGIILAKNEIAKSYGIVTAETVWQAKNKCKDLVLVPPHHDKYSFYSKKINEIYEGFTDMVEPFSIDESWLDVTESKLLFGSGKEIADEIRNTVYRKIGLTLSVGVSFNKVFAKMGSEYKKPNATTVISRENYKEIIWPMDVGELFFVGRITAEKLRKIGIKTIGDLANWDRKAAVTVLGKQGGELRDYAAGDSDSPVCYASEKKQIKSAGSGITFKRNLKGKTDIKTAITALSDSVAARLRKSGMKCGGVKVDIKDPYFKTITRQKQIEGHTNLAEEIGKTAFEIMAKQWDFEKPIRMITVTGINLVPEGEDEQISLFMQNEEVKEKNEKMERTLDQIRMKYGSKAITFGGIVNNDMGIDFYEEKEED